TATRAERHATFWIAVMYFASLASLFMLRPIRGQLGVARGVEAMPELYSMTLLATVVVVVPFWSLANRMASRRFVPICMHLATAGLLLLAVGFSFVGEHRWAESPWIGKLFWGGFSAMNVAVPALIWIHAVEHYGKSQAKRLFGLVAVGGTLGAMAGSYGVKLPAQLGFEVPLWGFGVAAAALMQLGLFAFFRSHAPCLELDGGDTDRRHSSGGILQGLAILARDRRAFRIAIYIMLVGFVATAFEAAQTELVGEELDRAWEQQSFLADVGLYGNGVVLFLQVFWTGRIMVRGSAAVLLSALPVISIVGLGAYWLAPTAAAIFAIQVGRRGINYAVEKPAREVLYTPLDLATKHKVKFLLDTFAYRLGDLIGAVVQVWLRQLGLGVGAIVAVTVGFALFWIVIAVQLGRDQPSSSPPTS
ncbi:MAG: hypothetical protein KAI24_10635, partial [Planctomycetes bacterium]|nr:hypothetical protein [Planctomycetota bacterium]